jgi:GT2 family glycosyltransferase
MKKTNNPDIQLVITVALKKEIPKEWLKSHHVPVHTLSALKSGALTQLNSSNSGIVVLITGPGSKAGEEAACWICENLSPLFVINIGTCGVINRKHSLGIWIRPRCVSNEGGEVLEIDSRLPLPGDEKIMDVHSLISVKKSNIGHLPASWELHDIIDMECHSQAEVFNKTGISFHCLKFSVDYSDLNAISDFNRNLDIFKQSIKKLFNLPCSPALLLIPPLVRGDAEGFHEHQIKITVIIPVFNRAHTIKRAIDSVLSQSHMPEEIIVVDDGSTDNTKKILEGYGDKIICIHLSRNSGPSRARNEGIKHARSNWIAFLDSDDCWGKNKLGNQLAYLGRYPFYQIIQSEEIWMRKGVRVNPRRHHTKPVGWIWEPSLERCLVSPSGVLVKKALLGRFGNFDESMPVSEDYDLWLKISRHHPVGLDPGLSVVKYGGHKDQLSRKYPAMDMFRVASLVNALKTESEPDFRRKLIEILTKKLNILINGCEKRGKVKNARQFRGILDSLNMFQ